MCLEAVGQERVYISSISTMTVSCIYDDGPGVECNSYWIARFEGRFVGDSDSLGFFVVFEVASILSKCLVAHCTLRPFSTTRSLSAGIRE